MFTIYQIYHLLIYFSAEIAKRIPEDSFGLIFGINTFFAYWFQIIFSLTVPTDLFGWDLSIFDQFNVYGVFCIVLGCIYFILILINGIPILHKKKQFIAFTNME